MRQLLQDAYGTKDSAYQLGRFKVYATDQEIRASNQAGLEVALGFDERYFLRVSLEGQPVKAFPLHFKEGKAFLGGFPASDEVQVLTRALGPALSKLALNKTVNGLFRRPSVYQPAPVLV